MKRLLLLFFVILPVYKTEAQLKYNEATEKFYCVNPSRMINQKNYHDLIMFLSKKTIGNTSSQFLTESMLILRFMGTPTALQLAEDFQDIYNSLKHEEENGTK